jgi:hypothetical protein
MPTVCANPTPSLNARAGDKCSDDSRPGAAR